MMATLTSIFLVPFVVSFILFPLISSADECIAWRKTSSCSSFNTRHPEGDKTCVDTILSTEQGFCECAKRLVSGCRPSAFRCIELCATAPTWHAPEKSSERIPIVLSIVGSVLFFGMLLVARRYYESKTHGGLVRIARYRVGNASAIRKCASPASFFAQA
eukprot:c1429_g1_i1.p1 GENE.c1429_g1_i1~~c1429_g1_i1.p1  ORF type:complete len:160 (-),score=23.54 c1429_g1_i1:269-748(-)